MTVYRVRYTGADENGYLWSADYKYLSFAQKRARALVRYGWHNVVIVAENPTTGGVFEYVIT